MPEESFRVLSLLRTFLLDRSAAIDAESLRALTEGCGIGEEYAYALLLASFCGLDVEKRDRELFRRYFLPMVRKADERLYQNDPYYRRVRVPDVAAGDCSLRTLRYQPCEAFVLGDLETLPDGRILPHIGFFGREFPYPAILEGERLWMSVTPNEIETMREPIRAARGRVLAYGLGMGYFAFMAAEKAEVASVTVVENNPRVLELFARFLLPQFPHGGKIHVVRADAFDFARDCLPGGNFEVAFADLWHDAADGLPLYRRLRALETLSPRTEYHYWIEKTMACYL